MQRETIRPAVRAYRASDGYKLHYRHWKPVGDAVRGYVVALHGIQSHSGWYSYSSRRLALAGYDVRFLDRRGSGMNEVERGHAVHADRLVNDVTHFIADICAERDLSAPGSPLTLLGISWGGKLAVAAAAKRPELVDNLALLYPGLRARVRPNLLQRRLLRLGMGTGKERKRVKIPLDDPTLFTADGDWQRFIREDPLSLHRASVGFLNASVQLDKLLRKPPANLRSNGLMMLAGADRIIDNARSVAFFERLALPRSRIEIYGSAAHTLEFEPNRERIVSDLIDWLNGMQTGGFDGGNSCSPNAIE